MGLYDRDYYRSEEPGYHVSIASWSLTTKIVIINVVIYVLQLVSRGERGSLGWFSDTLSLHPDWWTRPWMFFELLTYGFLHATDNIGHILGNMITFWFLGRDLEAKYGRKEFLIFYLTAIVLAGLAWSGMQFFVWGNRAAPCWGASGGVAAVLVLFALNYPRRELHLWLVFPVPVWILATVVVAMDIYGALFHPHNIGYEAHLGGAALALAYYQLGWRLSPWVPAGLRWPSLRRRPKLRVHRPDTTADADLESRVDQILTKIQEQGLDSLTRKERQILEKAGEKYKQRRR